MYLQYYCLYLYAVCSCLIFMRFNVEFSTYFRTNIFATIFILFTFYVFLYYFTKRFSSIFFFRCNITQSAFYFIITKKKKHYKLCSDNYKFLMIYNRLHRLSGYTLRYITDWVGYYFVTLKCIR